MISASESPPVADANEAGACGVVAAISMPRSNAAVLTLASTPSWPKSFALFGSPETEEAPADEGDSGFRDGFESCAIRTGKNQPAPSLKSASSARRRLG